MSIVTQEEQDPRPQLPAPATENQEPRAVAVDSAPQMSADPQGHNSERRQWVYRSGVQPLSYSMVLGHARHPFRSKRTPEGPAMPPGARAQETAAWWLNGALECKLARIVLRCNCLTIGLVGPTVLATTAAGKRCTCVGF